MRKQYREMFHTSTTLISTILVILGAAGIYLTPQNRDLLFIGIGITIVVIFLAENARQVAEHSERLAELAQKLNTERRFSRIEQDIAEQRGKLSVVMR